jgi:hypothetical protein
MAMAAKAALGAEKLDAVADRGYFSGEEILECENAGITIEPLVGCERGDCLRDAACVEWCRGTDLCGGLHGFSQALDAAEPTAHIQWGYAVIFATTISAARFYFPKPTQADNSSLQFSNCSKHSRLLPRKQRRGTTVKIGTTITLEAFSKETLPV